MCLIVDQEFNAMLLTGMKKQYFYSTPTLSGFEILNNTTSANIFHHVTFVEEHKWRLLLFSLKFMIN